MGALGLLSGMRRTALGLLVCVGGAACSDLGPETLLGELERNQSRWEATRPASYVFAIERLCFCGVESRGPVRVRVQGTAVVERIYVDTGGSVPPALAELFPTVDGLFALVRSAIEDGAYEVRVMYHAVLGVPIDIWIDYIENAIDDELGVTVTESVEAPAGA